MQCDSLWDSLLQVLDEVRKLEGLVELAPIPVSDDEDEKPAATRMRSDSLISYSDMVTKEAQMQPSLSALPMRFMPLMECFLTVCGIKVVQFPELQDIATRNTGKIKITGTNATESSFSSAEFTADATSSKELGSAATSSQLTIEIKPGTTLVFPTIVLGNA